MKVRSHLTSLSYIRVPGDCSHGSHERLQVVPTDVWQFLVEDWKRAEQMRFMEEAATAARTAELARQCVQPLSWPCLKRTAYHYGAAILSSVW